MLPRRRRSGRKKPAPRLPAPRTGGAGSGGLGDESVEQVVLGCLEPGDVGDDARPVATHGLGVAGRFAVLALGDGGLGHERAEAGIVCGLRQVKELLVSDLELLPELLQPLPDLSEPPFDLASRHTRILRPHPSFELAVLLTHAWRPA